VLDVTSFTRRLSAGQLEENLIQHNSRSFSGNLVHAIGTEKDNWIEVSSLQRCATDLNPMTIFPNIIYNVYPAPCVSVDTIFDYSINPAKKKEGDTCNPHDHDRSHVLIDYYIRINYSWSIHKCAVPPVSAGVPRDICN